MSGLYHPLNATESNGAAGNIGLLMGHGSVHIDTAQTHVNPIDAAGARMLAEVSERIGRRRVDAAAQVQSALDRQEGGSHYKDMPIQPFEYIHANGIGFAEGAAIKYLSRWRSKNGLEDLKKARHFIDLLIEAEVKKAGQGQGVGIKG